MASADALPGPLDCAAEGVTNRSWAVTMHARSGADQSDGAIPLALGSAADAMSQTRWVYMWPILTVQ